MSKAADAETMGAFGASEEACFRYPGESMVDIVSRAAFCAGAGWAAKNEIDRMLKLLKEQPPYKIRVTVKGDCGKVHASFEEWQQCESCEKIGGLNARTAVKR